MVTNIPLNKISLASGGSTVKRHFITTWKTDNVGTSEDNEISLPFVSGGSYNCIVDWGDGNSDTITVWNQAETTHTYSSSGTYTVKINGQCWGWQFNNGGDCLKLLTIKQWGKNFKLNAGGGHFYGCANLVINAKDYLDVGTTTNMAQCFRACASLTTNSIKFRDTSNVTTIWAMFYGCSNFNGDVSSLDTSSVNSMADVFGECNKFNQPLNDWDTSEVTSMYAMFYNAYVFNQTLSNWDTSKVTDMRYTFYGCTAFNQDISNFNIEAVTQINNMLSNATSFSTNNYDNFLIEIATNQDVTNSLTFHCSSYYTPGGEAASARADLISTDLWTINDLGEAA
jgi:surface protein